MSKLMPVLRRNRKGLAISCLGAWLFAFAIGIAHACTSLPAAHALETAQSIAPQGEAGDDGDEVVGCDKSCSDGAPPVASVSSLQFFGTQVFIVQTWTDHLLPAIAVRAQAANHRGVSWSGAPPRLPHLRLTL